MIHGHHAMLLIDGKVVAQCQSLSIDVGAQPYASAAHGTFVLTRRGFIGVTAPAIERRLPPDFIQGRSQLARALAEAEYDFAAALAKAMSR